MRGDRALLLERWRAELRDAYLGKARAPGRHRARRRRAALPPAARPCSSTCCAASSADLRGAPIETFDDLDRYCYRVASTVGLLLVRVLEARDPGALDYAEAMGIAVQLTNVLRDVGEDAASGRIYLAARGPRAHARARPRACARAS